MSLDINMIHNIDCNDGIEQMDNSKVGLVVTDPPYDVGYDKKLKEYESMNDDTGADTSKQVDRDKNYVEFKDFNYMRFAFGLKNVMKDDTHAYIFCGDRQLFKWYDVMNYAGFKLNDILIWVKNRQTFSLGLSYHYSYKHEYCMMWSKGSRKLRKAGLCTVLNYDIVKDYLHPTQKPLEMIEFLILNSSNDCDLVFDPFMGSGTTAVAAKRLNRNFVGFEISKEYCDIANKRIDGVNKKVDLFSFESD